MTEIQYSSPACALRAADDVYMGYAGRDELRAALGRLRLAAEEPWRAMLSRHLAALQGDAAVTPPEPLAGGEVGELLRRLLPRVRDDGLHADLSALLRCYDGA